MLPPRIWKNLEGGLIESFGMEGKSVVMLTDEAKYEVNSGEILRFLGDTIKEGKLRTFRTAL